MNESARLLLLLRLTPRCSLSCAMEDTYWQCVAVVVVNFAHHTGEAGEEGYERYRPAARTHWYTIYSLRTSYRLNANVYAV